jgi:two-component system, chemotaxis family, CheB/CheR fusion protein
VDFTHYKRTTIERRLTRRMAVHQIERLANYANLLQENPSEVQALFQDLLIRVTNFFRDPEMFQALAEDIVPRLLEDKTSKNPLRIWVGPAREVKWSCVYQSSSKSPQSPPDPR